MGNIDRLTVRDNLIELVEAYPKLSENYNMLIAHYWVLYDDVSKLSDVGQATSSETITRQFRRLVEEGLVKIPERVEKRRREKEREYRAEFSRFV